MNVYTDEADQKFYRDTQIRYFPGNTIICFLEPDSNIYKEAAWCLSRLLTLSFSHKYSILPPASFHMTVFDLFNDNQRLPEQLRNRMGSDISIKKLDEYLEKQVPEIEKPPEIRMKYSTINLDKYFTINLEPATDRISASLSHYRKTLSNITGIPVNEKYFFHISLAYLIINLNEEEKTERDENLREMRERFMKNLDEFTLPAPHLTFFDTMYAFYKDKSMTFRWWKST